MKKKRLKPQWHKLRAPKDDTETTKVYTAEDYQTLSAKDGNGAGILRPGTGNWHIPTSLEDMRTGSPPKVVMVIVLLALIFIMTMAYFVSQMPEKP